MSQTRPPGCVYVNFEIAAAREQRDDITLSVKVMFLCVATEQLALLGRYKYTLEVLTGIFIFFIISRRTFEMRQPNVT